jgi:hypothetical protein
MSMASPTLAGAPQWQREVWRRQQDEMVAVPSYLDVDKAEADAFLAYVARLRSASSTANSTTTTATTATSSSSSTSSPASSSQPSPSTKKKQEKQKKEKRSGSGLGGSTAAAAGGEKATNKRWKRRKQSLGEVAVSEEAPATSTSSPSSSPRREAIDETILEHRVQIQVRALARYNLLARATTHVVEREA